MPHTILLRLSAPMQSWGVSSRFSIRDSAKEPTKSGVIGLLCAALGISREEANTDNPKFAELLDLKMGVRELKKGILESDFHTAVNVSKSSGKRPTKDKDSQYTVISTRYYLADADFVVGLESEDQTLLENLQEALKKPKWHLFLGRKSFPPAEPVFLPEGVRANTNLNNALAEFVEINLSENSEKQRLIIEDERGTETVQDVPLNFAKRHFSLRRVRTEFFIPENITGGNEDGSLSDEDDSKSAF